jgi:hypothetical protein
MSDEDELADGDLPGAEATGRLEVAIRKCVSYHITEYDMTAATVVGTLALEMFRRMRDVFADTLTDAEDDDEFE